MPEPATADTPEFDVVVLGAGMSGLCMAIELRRAGIARFVVLEKSAGLGGTWWDNRYPGAHVDVPSPLYSFSFEPNPHATRRFAAAADIQAYMAHCARKYGLLAHMRFGTTVRAARFDESAGLWRIELADRSVLRARFFVCSTGPLSQARWPDIAGLDRFAGRLMHSARWDTTVPLQGQRIGVIGTGSTASQLVPPLAERAARLHVFQRTANWVLPRIDRRYTAFDRALARVPAYYAAVRAGWHALLEWGRRGFEDGSFARRQMQRAGAMHLRRGVPDAALRERLQPRYPLGCKRIIYSNDFYPALSQPNVELVTGDIESIETTGVRTIDGRLHELDVLVCATGFDVQHSLAAVPISGRGGGLLSEAWAKGPQAHLGLTVAGFPNLFLMLGPNTATGHTSTLLYIEPGVRWVVRAMQEVRKREQRWLDVKPAVMARFNAAVQTRLTGSVWSQCRSWYRADGGKIIAIWPGFTREYVQAVAAQTFDDFEFG